LNIKRVLVCSSELLLGAIVIRLLDSEIDIDVIGLSSIDETNLTEAIHLFQPDTVIYPLPLLDTDDTLLTKIIADLPELNLISIYFDDNRVQAYTKREIVLTHASDLAEIIRSQ